MTLRGYSFDMQSLQISAYMKHLIILIFVGMACLADAQPLEKNTKDKKLVPDYALLQYAGSIGALSIGAGYEIGKNQKVNLEFFYSVTPKFDGDAGLDAFTVKGLFSILDSLCLSQNKKIRWNPLKVGLGLSYIADSEFFSFLSASQYPNGYYWHQSGLRGLLLMQSDISIPVRSKVINEIEWYIEANVQDIYATMYIADKSLP